MLIKSVKSLATIFALLIGATAYAQGLPPEAPLETNNISITRAQPGGLVLARPCENCAMLTLQFDANSKAMHNGSTVSLTAIPEHVKGAITIIYDPNTMIIRRVRW